MVSSRAPPVLQNLQQIVKPTNSHTPRSAAQTFLLPRQLRRFNLLALGRLLVG
jgi:hypothetical protein